MMRQSVFSSNINSVGYNKETFTLEIEFHHGGIYIFYNISPTIFHELMASTSKGIYFANNIKGKYDFIRII